jgi:hypothetical protein
MYRLRADIEADDPGLIGEIIAAALSRLALTRIRAWEEIRRIASVNEDTERMELSFATNEILVYDCLADDVDD